METWEPHESLAYDQMPETKIAMISNVWIKMMTFKKPGDFIPGHKHLFDHPTLLSQGMADVEVDGVITRFCAPAIIYVEKEKAHKITAVIENTVACCIHAIRDGEAIEDIVAEDMIPKGSRAMTVTANFGLTPFIRPQK
jgi:hypothetical protein